MNIWYEYVPLSLNRSGNMLPESKLGLMTAAYRSVYGFHANDAMSVRRSGHSRGFSEYEVFADRLTLDIDDGDVGLRPILETLDHLGFGYSLYSSGGKGYHVEIPHQPLWHRRLPELHALHVKVLFAHEVDMSLYQHGRVISSVGRRHPKTGKRKALLESKVGSLMELPIYDLPDKPVFESDKDLGFDGAIGAIYRRAINPPGVGNRHTVLWSLASLCFRAAFSIDLTTLLLQELNLSWPNPKSPEEVDKAVQQAYRKSSSDI